MSKITFISHNEGVVQRLKHNKTHTMSKKYKITAGLCILHIIANAQGVGIGITEFTPVGSALLELRSSNKGFLPPVMTREEMMSIPNPAEGLIVYSTTEVKGLYYHSNLQWLPVSDGMGNHVAVQNISLSGNWLGNNGADDGIYVNFENKIGFGTNNPKAKIDINGDIAYKIHTINLSNGLNNNITASDAVMIRIIGPSSSYSISGIDGGVDGRLLYLYNSTPFDLKILNDSPYSFSQNRILTLNSNNTNATSEGKSVTTLIYSEAESRWIIVAQRR